MALLAVVFRSSLIAESPSSPMQDDGRLLIAIGFAVLLVLGCAAGARLTARRDRTLRRR